MIPFAEQKKGPNYGELGLQKGYLADKHLCRELGPKFRHTDESDQATCKRKQSTGFRGGDYAIARNHRVGAVGGEGHAHIASAGVL